MWRSVVFVYIFLHHESHKQKELHQFLLGFFFTTNGLSIFPSHHTRFNWEFPSFRRLTGSSLALKPLVAAFAVQIVLKARQIRVNSRLGVPDGSVSGGVVAPPEGRAIGGQWRHSAVRQGDVHWGWNGPVEASVRGLCNLEWARVPLVFFTRSVPPLAQACS